MKESDNPVWLNRLMLNKWDEIKEAFISEIKELNPDAIIHCGDFTHSGTKADFAYGKSILDATGVDWYAVPGNHDAITGEVKNELRILYGAADTKGFYYSRRFGGIAVSFLDVCVRSKENTYAIDDSALDWLGIFLKENPDKTVFLVCHIPVRHKTVIADQGTFNYGERIIRGKIFGRYIDKVIGKIENAKKLRKLISENSHVKAVFSGHWHINSLHISKDVYYRIIPSVCEYPCEVVIADCGVDGIRVYNKTLDTLGLREKSILPERNNKWVIGSKKTRDTLIK